MTDDTVQTTSRGISPLRLAILAAFAVLVGLAGTFALPPLDRDESRFAQATTQMLETGDYINIRFQERERNKKPAGIYWLQAASVSLFSSPEAREIWAYRLPSLLGAVLAALMVYWTGTRLFNEETGFFGTLLLIALPVFAGEATIAKTDAVLLATVVGAQAALAAQFLAYLKSGEKPGWAGAVLYWIAIGAGVLIKGPITPMISFLCVIVLTGVLLLRERRLPMPFLLGMRPVSGLLIVALISGPWFAAIGLSTDGRFFAEAVGTDMAGKLSTGQESHGGPFGYHLVALLVMFWPGVIFLPAAMRKAVQDRAHWGVVFCLAWVLPGWLVFEIASTKLAHYTLPLYPALALLCAHYALGVWRRGIRFRVFDWAGIAAYIVGLAVIAGGLFLYGPFEYASAGLRPVNYLAAGVLVLLGLAVMAFTGTGKMARALVLTSLTGGLLAWTLFEGLLPSLDRFNTSTAISDGLREAKLHPVGDDAPDVALVGYTEPSAIFLIGTGTELPASAEDAARWIDEEPGRTAIVEARQEAAFLAAAGSERLKPVFRVEGCNYNRGDDDFHKTMTGAKICGDSQHVVLTAWHHPG